MSRTLTALTGNSQRLDGGAMFGNAPKALWSRWSTPDAENRIPLACRCALVREPGRNVLLEAGIGAFFPPKLRERYGVVEEGHVLLDSLRAEGLSHEDIDAVVLSHLHFDHAGGLLESWQEGRPQKLLFPRATFIVGRRAWERALAPHPRDRASFVPELMTLLQESGRVEVVDTQSEVLGPDWRLHFSEGHTPGLMLTEMALDSGPVLFAGDLVPGRPWVHAPITMGYDRFPELLIDEKTALLTDLVARGGRLFFTHDPEVAMCALRLDERGRFTPVDEVVAPREWS